jgi:hypothetical protein
VRVTYVAFLSTFVVDDPPLARKDLERADRRLITSNRQDDPHSRNDRVKVFSLEVDSSNNIGLCAPLPLAQKLEEDVHVRNPTRQLLAEPYGTLFMECVPFGNKADRYPKPLHRRRRLRPCKMIDCCRAPCAHCSKTYLSRTEP